MQSVKLQFDKSTEDYRMKEAFKTLRTNIEFCGKDVKVVAVTSCTPNEGKSSVAMEMAKAFAEAGNKTILIDADMRKSVLVGRYRTGAVRQGMTHCLSGRAEYQDVLCETNIHNLYVIFSGPVPPNPSELLGGDKFASLIQQARYSFDYIIIDTPPLGSVIDAAVAAKNCDGTVLVVENNAVSYKFVQRVKDQLDKTGSRILGVVLNKVDMSSKGYYGHYGRYYGKYYGRYYGKYGEDNSVEKAVQHTGRFPKKDKGKNVDIDLSIDLSIEESREKSVEKSIKESMDKSADLLMDGYRDDAIDGFKDEFTDEPMDKEAGDIGRWRDEMPDRDDGIEFLEDL